MRTGYGTNYKVERSTFDTYPAWWLFVRNSPNGPVKGTLHLNERQIRELRDTLTDVLGETPPF